MEQRKTLVINYFGGPGSGKSTAAAKTYAALKERGYLTELATEYAKDLVWQESFNVLKNQIYIFGKQHHRIWRLNGKVDIIVTDSPFVLGMVYAHDSEIFRQLILEEHHRLWTLNIFLNRNHKFEKEGRYHDEEQSLAIDRLAKEYLEKYDIPYYEFKTGQEYWASLMIFITKYFEMGVMSEKRFITPTGQGEEASIDSDGTYYKNQGV